MPVKLAAHWPKGWRTLFDSLSLYRLQEGRCGARAGGVPGELTDAGEGTGGLAGTSRQDDSRPYPQEPETDLGDRAAKGSTGSAVCRLFNVPESSPGASGPERSAHQVCQGARAEE